MASSYNRGYVKPAIGGTPALTAFVPVVAESKFLSLSLNSYPFVIPEDGAGNIGPRELKIDAAVHCHGAHRRQPFSYNPAHIGILTAFIPGLLSIGAR